MTDTLSKQQRSNLMRRIKAKNSKPELRVRKFLYSQGLRYRLHSAILPGKPDIVISKYRSVVFVHGCFWHQHEGCKHSHIPKSNLDYWKSKLQKNVLRDCTNFEKIHNLGWRVFVVWECMIDDESLLSLYQKIVDYP